MGVIFGVCPLATDVDESQQQEKKITLLVLVHFSMLIRLALL